MTLAADVMFISGMPIFVACSRKIKLTTAEYLPHRTTVQLSNSLKKLIYLYARGGFLVQHALMDMDFVKVKELVPLVEDNTTAAREHVAVIEHKICHVKERVQVTISEYPFRWIPVIVLVHTMYFCVLWLNAFPKRPENYGFCPKRL